MHEPGLDISEEFYAYKDRASGYIARASHFPFQWGLPNGAKNKNGFPIEFFRWDRRVLKRMVDRAEHIIRCLIIWMAWARLRSGLVEPVYSPLLARGPRPGQEPGLDALRPTLGRNGIHTSDCAGAECPEPQAMEQHSSIENKKAPVHHLYSIRGLPLYDLRVPPFKVSLPSETSRSSLRTQGSGSDGQDSRLRGNERESSLEPALCGAERRENKSKRRPRNDKVFSSEILIMRMERLGKLYDEIDTRVARIAGLWLWRMTHKEKALLPWWEKGWDEGGARSANQPPNEENSIPLTPAPLPPRERGALNATPQPHLTILPIKSPDPPPDMMEGAPDDERDDVLALHDGAIRAAELFVQHCG